MYIFLNVNTIQYFNTDTRELQQAAQSSSALLPRVRPLSSKVDEGDQEVCKQTL